MDLQTRSHCYRTAFPIVNYKYQVKKCKCKAKGNITLKHWLTTKRLFYAFIRVYEQNCLYGKYQPCLKSFSVNPVAETLQKSYSHDHPQPLFTSFFSEQNVTHTIYRRVYFALKSHLITQASVRSLLPGITTLKSFSTNTNVRSCVLSEPYFACILRITKLFNLSICLWSCNVHHTLDVHQSSLTNCL